MRLRAFIRTRIALRLFVLFMLSAFLPLAALGMLSFLQVRSVLLQEGEQRLSSLAKAYGMQLFERLALASDIARTLEVKPSRGFSEASLGARTFSAISLLDADGNATAILGAQGAISLPSDARARLGEGKSVAWIAGGPTSPRVMVVVGASTVTGSLVVAEVAPAFLWGDEDERPAATEFCIVEETSRRILHCPAGMDQEALRALEARAATTSRWVRAQDGEPQRARTWSQFLRAGFGTPDWMVIASQPEGLHLARAIRFARIYVPVVALTLVLVTWLTMRQSRNIVDPVERLAERARGVEKGDFSTRLELDRRDEFGELGGAFDRMADRLGRQFESLTALSEIDRLILSTQDTAQMVRIVLHRIGNVVANDFATITLFGQGESAHAQTYFCPPEAPGSVTMVRHEIEAPDRLAFEGASHARDVRLATGEPVPRYLEPLREAGMEHARLHAIVWRGDACGVLALGYRAMKPWSEEESRGASELADRMAVAVSSALRDEQLYAQAHFDPLTGLPNRLLFEDRLEREIFRAQREGMQFAVLFVDLDHFKNVNDSFGHNVGDRVLREAAARLSTCVRNSDTVSRMGGDEFTVLATALHNPQEAWLIAETIVGALSRPFDLGEQQCYLSASVGIASFPADGQSVEQLLKSADTAMYRAKAGGRAQSVFFEERMNADTVSRLTLDRDLRVAIDRGELVLHYQPKLDLRSGRINGAEALIRWQHPVHGLISPARFIPLAEESGFIEQIGQWTIERACAQMKAWRIDALPMERIAINFSPRQFRRRTLIDFVARCMSESSLPTSAVEIEITEGLLVERGTAVEQMLRELSSAGHRIALDDFGTGFSSLAYLMRLPVDTIKIDRVFIDGLHAGADSEAIVAAIIAMSHALGMSVVAEGVETDAQVALLRAMGCDEIQGFLIAAALSPEDFEKLVRSLASSVDTEDAYGSWMVSNTGHE